MPATANAVCGGGNCYDKTAILPRKAGMQPSAQRAPVGGNDQHRARFPPKPGCQGSEAGIVNSSGDLPSLPQLKTIEVTIVSAAGCDQKRESALKNACFPRYTRHSAADPQSPE